MEQPPSKKLIRCDAYNAPTVHRVHLHLQRKLTQFSSSNVGVRACASCAYYCHRVSTEHYYILLSILHIVFTYYYTMYFTGNMLESY